MAFHGDPFHKRIIQKGLSAAGYKLVRLKAYELDAPDQSQKRAGFNKIFGIGFNKTATTTLEKVLRDWDIRMPKQLDQEKLLADCLDVPDYEKMRAFIDDYDALQDLPFSQNTTYVACDALFPNSKFILTLRDPQAWVKSYIGYYRREFGLEDEHDLSEASFLGKTQYLEKNYVHRIMRRLLVEDVAGAPVIRWDLAFDPDFLVAAYQKRNAEVLSYFAARPDDLFVLDPSQEADTGRLAAFLQMSDRATGPYPRTNKGASDA